MHRHNLSVLVQPARRFFLKALGTATGIALSAGILVPSVDARATGQSFEAGDVEPVIDSATPAEPLPKAWTFPTHIEITRIMNDAHYVGGDPTWHGRAMWFVDALWPAMAMTAERLGQTLSEQMYESMLSIPEMENFAATHQGSPEADAVTYYLTCLPGYRRSHLSNETVVHHAFLTMQVSYAIRLNKELVA